MSIHIISYEHIYIEYQCLCWQYPMLGLLSYVIIFILYPVNNEGKEINTQLNYFPKLFSPFDRE